MNFCEFCAPSDKSKVQNNLKALKYIEGLCCFITFIQVINKKVLRFIKFANKPFDNTFIYSVSRHNIIEINYYS